MLRVLLPVDGSESSIRAVQMAIQLYQRLAKVEVLLLHVEVADGVPPTALGEAGAAPADPLVHTKALLDEAGVPHTSEMRRGYVPPAIAEYANSMRCDAIVMGTRGLGSTGDVVGSIARQVIALSDLPVTLVK
ncbi:MAG TPA: universal stress protein [Casimicrobiaceae bacterium]|nr:universal stress protein [Casimicrobiaceae bacterium]